MRNRLLQSLLFLLVLGAFAAGCAGTYVGVSVPVGYGGYPGYGGYGWGPGVTIGVGGTIGRPYY